MYFTVRALLVVLLCQIGVSAQQRIVSAELSAKTALIEGYLKALSSGDDRVLTDFIVQNSSADSLKARPVDTRLPFLKQFRNDTHTVALERAAAVNDNEVKALVRAANNELFSFHFVFEAQPPFKITAVQIQPAAQDADSSGPPTPAGPPLDRAGLVTQIGDDLDQLVRADQFSGVVLVAEADKFVFAKAFGWADADKKTPNAVDTKFNIGSIDKIFTQVAIGQLVRAGKLSWDDHLIKFLPAYPNRDAAEKITIRQLLAHTSGVPDFFGDAFRAAPKAGLRSINDFLPLFASKPLAFEPGTKQQYSNGGYILLGAIIEKVAGESYYDYVDKNIFRPLKMNNTAFYEADKPVPNMAEGYTTIDVDPASGQKRRNNLSTRPARGTSAGGGYSTAEDLLKFALACRSGKIVILSEGDPNKPAGGAMGIAGGSPGVNAALELMPLKGYTIIVLSNYDPRSAEMTARQIRELVGRLK